MKVRSLPNVLINYFQSIANTHSDDTRQATSNKYFHPRSNKKKMSTKLRGMRLWNNRPTSLVERKLNLGKKCFVKAAKKHFFNLQQSC